MDHYYSQIPTSESELRQVNFQLADGAIVKLNTDAGVFSGSRIDAGTQVLLREMPLPEPNTQVLDLGCGYGPIAVQCAVAERQCFVTAVDINERALALCRDNAKLLKLTNVNVCKPGDVAPELLFDRIYSNPPARVGKERLHEMLLLWLGRLQPHGDAYFVVQKHLGSDSLAKWLQEQGFEVKKLASKRAYRVLKVTH